MNQKGILKEYLLKLYNIFNKENYDYFLSFLYSYNISINDYDRDISNEIDNCKNKFIQLFKEKKVKYSLKDDNDSLKFNINSTNLNAPTTKIKMFIPIFLENFDEVLMYLLNYIVDEKINVNIKLLKRYKTDIITIKFNNIIDAQKIVSYYKKDKKINQIMKSKANPLIPYIDDLAIATELPKIDYLTHFSIILYSYYKKIKNEEDISVETLYSYLENKYNNSAMQIMKKIYYIYYKAIYTILFAEKPYLQFEYNANMNFGSYNVNDYKLLKDENGLIYYMNIEDKTLVSFGSEDYLNLTYSKLYSNIIEKSENITFYSYFLNIYNNLMYDNYKDLPERLSFDDTNKDDTYKLMLCIASGFFALKKIGYTLDEVNLMLKIALEKKLNCEIKIKTDEEILENKNKFKFPFNIEYGNQVFDLKNGKKTTVVAYFKKYYVLNTIPINSRILFKDGTSLTGEYFLKNIKDYAYKYNDFKELVDNLIDIIELEE